MIYERRFIVLRRVFLMLGLLYLYRAICFYVTVLPKADPQYYCSPQLNHTITFVELMQRCIRIISGYFGKFVSSLSVVLFHLDRVFLLNVFSGWEGVLYCEIYSLKNAFFIRCLPTELSKTLN